MKMGKRKVKISVSLIKEDKPCNTRYYALNGLTHFDLRQIYLLLKAEEARGEIIGGFYRGCSGKELLRFLEAHPELIGKDTVTQVTVKKGVR